MAGSTNNSHHPAGYFPWVSHHSPIYSTSNVTTENTKKNVYPRVQIINNYFYYFFQDILKYKWAFLVYCSFFSCKCMVVTKKSQLLMQFVTTALMVRRCQQVNSIFAFANVTIAEKAISLLHHADSFDFMDLLKGSWNSPGR